MKTLVLALLSLALALAGNAAEAKFPRAMTVKLLGYDPETSVASECETRANSARLVRVALVKERPAVERVQLHLTVAGFVGIARAICPKASAPEPLGAFAKAGEKLDKATCEAAGEALIGKLKKVMDDMVLNAHPDIAAGYIQGIGDQLTPLAEACYDHTDAWARIKSQAMLVPGRADSVRALKSCTLWRKAVYAELKKANTVGETYGRAKGLAYLKGKPIIAMTGSRALCTDELGRSFELSNYKLTEMMIGELPEKPAR